jgi:hypothetical protein
MICYAGLGEHSLRREIMIVLITVVMLTSNYERKIRENKKKIPLHLRASPTAQMRDSALQLLELFIHLPIHGSSVCKYV